MRAERVAPLVEQYRAAHDPGEPIETVLIDMIADLGHLFNASEDRDPWPYDFELLLAVSLSHLEEER